MKTKVQEFREEKQLTQTELAQKSKLSLRTIQRIEAGNIPKGYTLKALAEALEIEVEDFIAKKTDNEAVNRAKLINISVLSSLIIPFGNIIFPSILTYQTKEPLAKEIGKHIISIQIIYTIILSLLMIVSPFLQKALSTKIPLFLIFLLVLQSINMILIFKNGASLSQKSKLYISLKNNIL
jgi:transcriptional regulator with XRE-family HTH domain